MCRKAFEYVVKAHKVEVGVVTLCMYLIERPQLKGHAT